MTDKQILNLMNLLREIKDELKEIKDLLKEEIEENVNDKEYRV